MKIENQLHTVSFTPTRRGNWLIKLNGNIVMVRDGWVETFLSFPTLEKAVKAAKKKGYVPKNFDAQTLKNNVKCSVKGA